MNRLYYSQYIYRVWIGIIACFFHTTQLFSQQGNDTLSVAATHIHTCAGESCSLLHQEMKFDTTALSSLAETLIIDTGEVAVVNSPEAEAYYRELGKKKTLKPYW